MVRFIASLSGVLACACSMSSGTFTKNPYTFPSQADLQQVAVRPPPQKLYSEQVTEVESWTVENTRSQATQAVFAGELPFADQVKAALAEHGASVLVSDALTCVAQETARFRATTQGSPSHAVERFIAARCGSSYQSEVAWLSVATDLPPDQARQRFASQLPETLSKALAQAPTAIGVGYVHLGQQVVATVALGRSRVSIGSLALAPDDGGRVQVEGELPFQAEGMRALINQGARSVADCTRDEAVSLPRFRFSCDMAPSDGSAWLQVLAQPRGRLLSQSVLELLAVRPGASVDAYSVVQKREQLVASAEEFERHALVAVNEMRAEAGLPPLVRHDRQAQATRAMAPHFFHALHVSHDMHQADTIATGLLAGWEVEKTIRDGSFVAGMVGASHDVHAWVREVLDTPIGRDTLLDPEAQGLALGAVVSQEPPVMGALVYTYAFFEGHDHARDANALAERIRAARAGAGLPAIPRALSVEERTWKRAREVLLAGRDPEVALNDALSDAAYITETRVRGYVVATTQPGAVELPKELLSPRVTSFAVASTHYQPKGSRWAVQVLFIVFTEGPGGSA